MSTQHGSTYSGPSQTQDGHIFQVGNINANTVQIGGDNSSIDFLEWLYALPYDFKHKKTRRERVESSGTWLFETEEYQKWYHSTGSDRLFWCHGKPGAGKTFIASMVIDKLISVQKEQDTGVAYIYLDHADRETQTLGNIFANILKQISLCKEKETVDGVRRIWSACQKGARRPDMDVLVEALGRISQHFERIFVVVDALDECSDKLRPTILKQLQSLEGPKWWFFLTGRSHLLDVPTKFPSCLQVVVSAHHDDVGKLVRARIDDDAGLAELFEKNPSLKDYAISKIIEKSNGMFLMATLMLNNIASSICENDIEESLDQMPVDLDQSYERTLERIKDQNPKKVELSYRILWWLSRARRPLSCEELPHAIAIRDGDRGRNPRKESTPGIMTTVCMGLVFIDDAKKFRFVHFSTQEYLRAYLSLSTIPDILREDELIARACITVLLYAEFEDGPYNSYPAYKVRQERHPILLYAAKYWHEHLDESMSEELHDLALKLLRSLPKVRAATEVADGSWYPRYAHTTGLHIASKYGMVSYVKELIQELGIDINAIDDDGETPLGLAIRNGHCKVVELLLRTETIDHEFQNKSGETPFLIAAEGTNTRVVEQLLAKGVAVQAQDHEGHNALHRAAFEENAQMVELLVAAGVEISAESEEGITPLHIAALCGTPKLVEILLSWGADIAATDRDGQTPLHYAAKTDLEIVLALYKAGADIDARDNHGHSVFHIAIARDQSEIVEWLLSLYSQSPRRDVRALQFAVARVAICTVKLLVRQGVDCNAHCGSSGSALQAACAWGDIDVVQLLLDHGANIYQKGGQYGFPLSAAASRGRLRVLHLLVEWDPACVAMIDDLGRNALHFAAREGHVECFEFLLSKGADLNSIDVKGNTILHCAAAGGSDRLVKWLLDHGATSSSGTHNTWSPLHWAYRSESSNVMDLLRTVYSEEEVVETVQPIALWTPLSIGLYHGVLETHPLTKVDLSKNLLSSSSSQLEMINTSKGIVPHRVGAFHRGHSCYECFRAICGPRFQCTSCKDLSVCFMCKLTVAKSHPHHQWKIFEYRYLESVEVKSAEL